MKPRKSRKQYYLTSYCNQSHSLVTGEPRGHDCYTLPVEALKLERDGKYREAIEILTKFPVSPR